MTSHRGLVATNPWQTSQIHGVCLDSYFIFGATQIQFNYRLINPTQQKNWDSFDKCRVPTSNTLQTLVLSKLSNLFAPHNFGSILVSNAALILPTLYSWQQMKT